MDGGSHHTDCGSGFHDAGCHAGHHGGHHDFASAGTDPLLYIDLGGTDAASRRRRRGDRLALLVVIVFVLVIVASQVFGGVRLP
jgi:hypothetical protein